MMDFYDSNLVLIQATLIGLLLALSIQVPLRMGVFSFAGVGCYGIGAYGGGILVIHYQTSPLVTIVLAALGAALASFGLALLINRLGGLYLGMATIAFDLIISVVAVNGGDLTGGPTGLYGAISSISMGLVFAIVVVAVVVLTLTERGRLGRRVQAVRDDPELAASMGIRVRRYRIAAFVVSGILGGAAGAINTLLRTTVGPTDIGFALVVLALTMIIVGGARSWLGALIGAIIFTWLPSILEVVGQWQHIIYGIIVALAAIWIPGGLLGVMTEGWRAFQRRRRPPLSTVPVVAVDGAPPDADLAVLEELAEDSPVERSAT
jgi:branched-chain amino acid transport system permease protein